MMRISGAQRNTGKSQEAYEAGTPARHHHARWHTTTQHRMRATTNHPEERVRPMAHAHTGSEPVHWGIKTRPPTGVEPRAEPHSPCTRMTPVPTGPHTTGDRPRPPPADQPDKTG